MKKEDLIKTLLEPTLNDLIKILDKTAISKQHNKAEIDWDCPECRFRMIKAGLEWWLDLERWGKRINKK